VAELRQMAKRAAIYFYETGQRYVFGDIGANVSNFVMAEANADYRRKIRVKTLHAMRAKAERGHVLGSAPFGYRNVDVVTGTDASGRPVRSHVTREIVETQAAVVRDIFGRYARGQGFKQIALALNRAGVPTPRPRARKHDDGVVRLIRPASRGAVQRAVHSPESDLSGCGAMEPAQSARRRRRRACVGATGRRACDLLRSGVADRLR
jgi:hypothetical protein